MPVGGIHDQHIDARLDQRHRALPSVVEEPDRGADSQPSGLVLGRQRELLALGEVLHRDEPLQPTGRVDQRQLLDLVLGQQAEGHLLVHADLSGDQRHRGHHLGHRTGEVRLESQVAVGDDAYQQTAGVHHRKSGDPVLGAERVHLGKRSLRTGGHRMGNHARLGPFD